MDVGDVGLAAFPPTLPNEEWESSGNDKDGVEVLLEAGLELPPTCPLPRRGGNSIFKSLQSGTPSLKLRR